MPDQLPIETDRNQILYYVTIFEFPHATVRHQLKRDECHRPIENVDTFERWIELDAERIARRTGMKLAKVPNAQGQIALGVLKKS